MKEEMERLIKEIDNLPTYEGLINREVVKQLIWKEGGKPFDENTI